MKIKVLIVEDEALIAAEIAECMEENGFETSGIASTADSAIELVLQNKPDVILMDISIKGKINGIELAKQILASQNIPIIFLTSNSHDVVIKEAMKINPTAFLLKPFNEKELPVAIELAFNNHNQQILRELGSRSLLSDCVFVKSGKKFLKIKTEDIFFIQAEGSYSRLVTLKNEYMVSFNLSHFHQQIDNKYFIRIHRSFIINVKNVESFDTENVYINSKSIPMSKQFSDSFLNIIKKL